MIFIPSMVFPCHCMGEGITVTPLEDSEDISENEVRVEVDKELEDYSESPFIQLSFWEYGHCRSGRWSWWWRLKIAWRIFRDGSPWPDMVIMPAATAKKFAYHILYIIRKGEWEPDIQTLFEENRFICPRCDANLKVWEVEEPEELKDSSDNR